MAVSLVVMAAGMGSRFGGLKQIEPMGPNGEILADYSVYDAKRAGFSSVVFIIKKENEELFRQRFFDRITGIEKRIVFQTADDMPKERVKPWGTGHAVLCAAQSCEENFVVINADDFYGADAYRKVFDYISAAKGDYDYCIAGYYLKNTVSDKGSVARGICSVDEEGFLTDITETLDIIKTPEGLKSNGKSLDPDTLVSMNFFGLKKSFFAELAVMFEEFKQKNKENLQKAEFFLPSAVDRLIKQQKARVKVIPTVESWLGVTHKDDAQIVKDSIAKLVAKGVYEDIKGQT